MATSLAVVVGLVLVAAAGAGAAVSPAFHGVTVQESPTKADVSQMKRSGVGSVRVAFTWFNQEPAPGVYDWRETDATVAAIARSGARVLPVIYASPAWLEPEPEDPPVGSPEESAAWRRYLIAVATRYGPGGDFAAAHPGFRPIRIWQLGNEPNLTAFWGSYPDPKAYEQMLEVGHEAIRSVDRRAEVMTAGLSTASKGMQPNYFLKRVLDAAGGKPPFEILALHPYARTIDEMGRRIARSREVLDDAGLSGLSIAVTEAGWGSAGPPGYPPSGTPRSQAQMVTDFFATLADNREWHVSQAYWYSWRDLRREPDHCGFCTITGLLQANGTPKPSLRAFKRSVRTSRSNRTRR